MLVWRKLRASLCSLFRNKEKNHNATNFTLSFLNCRVSKRFLGDIITIPYFELCYFAVMLNQEISVGFQSSLNLSTPLSNLLFEMSSNTVWHRWYRFFLSVLKWDRYNLESLKKYVINLVATGESIVDSTRFERTLNVLRYLYIPLFWDSFLFLHHLQYICLNPYRNWSREILIWFNNTLCFCSRSESYLPFVAETDCCRIPFWKGICLIEGWYLKKFCFWVV